MTPRASSIEPRAHRVRTLKLTIAYDGKRYAGWQVQTRTARRAVRMHHNGVTPTVQGTLEAALSTALRERVHLHGSGRTDAGVHALAQVAHVRTRSRIAPERLLRSVNGLLPQDIAVLRVEETHPAFHARFHATRKHYRYRLFLGPAVPPFVRPYVHHVRVPLNTALIHREAKALRGTHDFRAFARAGSTAGGTRRKIYALGVRRRGEELHMDVEGSGFLHTMVRSIVGTLLEIGRGRLPPGTIRKMLRTRQRRLAGMTAPAHGLTLGSVGYRGGKG